MAGYVNYLVYLIQRYEVKTSVRCTGQLLESHATLILLKLPGYYTYHYVSHAESRRLNCECICVFCTIVKTKRFYLATQDELNLLEMETVNVSCEVRTEYLYII